MSASALSTERSQSPRWNPSGPDSIAGALLLAGFASLFVPLFWDFSLGTRADGMQGHEPAIFAVSAFLLYRKRAEIGALRFHPAPTAAVLLLALGFVLYVLGRAYDLRIALISFVVILAGVLLTFRGTAGLRAGWFALLFPLFALPLPFELVLAVTGPMKIAVSTVAAQLLSWAGYPAGNSGVVMTIGQYQLLVTEACAGLQTMFTLEAMGLLYVSLVGKGSPRHNGILAVLIVPIAFGANVIRVIVLALVTYYYGDAAGQGFLHGFSGIVLFATALAMVIIADDFLGRVHASGRRT